MYGIIELLGAACALSGAAPGLERNIARLHEAYAGAARALAWPAEGPAVEAPALIDGDAGQAAALPSGTVGVGLEWPIQHVVDGAALVWPGPCPAGAGWVVEMHDGLCWRPVTEGLREEHEPESRCRRWAFEPVATRALRVRLPAETPAPAELEVYRYLPASPTVWPGRLTDGRLEADLLASGEEPSFERLASQALSMPGRALLGVKDHPREVGVTWSGTVIAPKFDPLSPLSPPTPDYKRTHRLGFQHYTLQVVVGERNEPLAAFRDTVTRALLDGWRPGTVVSGRIRDLGVRQTAFLSFADDARTRPALFLRVEVTNRSDSRRATSVAAQLTMKSGAVERVERDCLADGPWLALVSAEPPSPAGPANALRFDVDLAPGASRAFVFVQPHGQTPLDDAAVYRAAGYDAALGRFRAYWDETLAPAAPLDLPEPRLNHLYKAVLAQLFINADGDIMPYGAEPSNYAGNLYGVEEGYAMMALAYAGFGADARRYLAATYLTPAFLNKGSGRSRHTQYRNGLAPSYAAGISRLDFKRDWVAAQAPLLRECAEWTLASRRETMVLEDGKKPLHWGLLPKWSYGGDVSAFKCYALFPNLACWRGLLDTAWLLEALGDAESARRTRAEVDDYRACIDRALEGAFLPDHKPPCLPLHLYADGPSPEGAHGDYYTCFACELMALLPDAGGRPARRIADYLERTGSLFCLMPRFRRDYGAGGLDGLYGKGYMLSKLHRDRIPEFLLALYGYLAFNLDRDVFAGRETNRIYASDLHVQEAPGGSDPLPCGAAVALHLLRHLLVTEEPDGQGGYSGVLRVLAGAPRAWFRDGQHIRFGPLPTHFGGLTCEVESEAGRGRIRAVVRPPARDPWTALHLRLRHPEGYALRAATVNGEACKDVEPGRELVILRPGPAEFRVEAEYPLSGPARKQ